MREIKKNMPKLHLQLGNHLTVRDYLEELRGNYEVYADGMGGWNVRRVKEGEGGGR